MHNDETILLKNNIKEHRQLIKEYVSRGDIINAIKNREIIKIYYKGEDTQDVGWRTIEPYVLGTSKAGNKVIRAWEQAGASDSFKGLNRTPRQNHERWNDYKSSKIVPGWRMFRLDGIKQIIPTNYNFSVNPDKMPPMYNPNDKDMVSVDIAVKVSDKDSVIYGSGSELTEPETTQKNVSVFDKQTQSWKLIPQDSKSAENYKKYAIDGLADMVRKSYKKRLEDYLVYFKDNKYGVVNRLSRDKYKYKNDEIIGNLRDLYIENNPSPNINRIKTNFSKSIDDFEKKLSEVE